MSFEWGKFSAKAITSILKSDARINIWDGAVRSGKTVSSIVAWLCFVAKAPPGPLLMMGKTRLALRRNILDPMEEMVGSRYMRIFESQGRMQLFGRVVHLESANNCSAEQRIPGLTLSGAYGDELVLWPKEVFQMLLSRLSVSGARFYGTTNPGPSRHWLLTDYLEKQDLSLTRWHFTLDDNPNLPEDYRQALKAEYTGPWYQRFVEGKWCASQGLVYDLFDPDRHVQSKPGMLAGRTRTWISCDYGIFNPCVFGLLKEKDGHYHLAREYYHDGRKEGQKTDNQYAADLRRFAAGETDVVVIDPSASSLITLLRQEGWRVVPARNQVTEGIQRVASLLEQGRLTVDPSCKMTVEEFESYVWEPEAVSDTPQKKNDHCMDMLRYGIMTHKAVLSQDRENFSGRGLRRS